MHTRKVIFEVCEDGDVTVKYDPPIVLTEEKFEELSLAEKRTQNVCLHIQEGAFDKLCSTYEAK